MEYESTRVQDMINEREQMQEAVRVLLPGLRIRNYTEGWADGSPAVRALSRLSEWVGEGSVIAGRLVDPATPPQPPAKLPPSQNALAEKYLEDRGIF